MANWFSFSFLGGVRIDDTTTDSGLHGHWPVSSNGEYMATLLVSDTLSARSGICFLPVFAFLLLLLAAIIATVWTHCAMLQCPSIVALTNIYSPSVLQRANLASATKVNDMLQSDQMERSTHRT